MSDQTTVSEGEHFELPRTSQITEVRYSLKAMMAEVRAERKNSALGRELVDSTEIDKMFTARKRKKKK